MPSNPLSLYDIMARAGWLRSNNAGGYALPSHAEMVYFAEHLRIDGWRTSVIHDDNGDRVYAWHPPAPDVDLPPYRLTIGQLMRDAGWLTHDGEGYYTRPPHRDVARFAEMLEVLGWEEVGPCSPREIDRPPFCRTIQDGSIFLWTAQEINWMLPPPMWTLQDMMVLHDWYDPKTDDLPSEDVTRRFLRILHRDGWRFTPGITQGKTYVQWYMPPHNSTMPDRDSDDDGTLEDLDTKEQLRVLAKRSVRDNMGALYTDPAPPAYRIAEGGATASVFRDITHAGNLRTCVSAVMSESTALGHTASAVLSPLDRPEKKDSKK